MPMANNAPKIKNRSSTKLFPLILKLYYNISIEFKEEKAHNTLNPAFLDNLTATPAKKYPLRIINSYVLRNKT